MLGACFSHKNDFVTAFVVKTISLHAFHLTYSFCNSFVSRTRIVNFMDTFVITNFRQRCILVQSRVWSEKGNNTTTYV